MNLVANPPTPCRIGKRTPAPKKNGHPSRSRAVEGLLLACFSCRHGGFFFNCFYAGRVGWETELFPGGGGLTCAETRNTQAYSEYADKTAAFLAFLTPPCAGWWFFGNNFRPALFTCTKRRACFQTNNAKPPPAGFGGVVRRSCAITKKICLFVRFFHVHPPPCARWPGTPGS